MRLIFCFPHPFDRLVDERAGHVVRANAMIEGIRRLGHEVMVVEAAAAPATAGAVRAYRGAVRSLLPRPAALALRDGGRWVAGRRYGARLARIARSFAPDAIVETHIDFVASGIEAAHSAGVPLILDDVSPIYESSVDGVGLGALARAVYRRNLRSAHRLVAVTPELARHFVTCGADPERVSVVSNGLWLEQFRPVAGGDNIRARHGLPADAFVVLFVGSFQRYHRVELLIDAMLHMARPELRLLLVGAGPTEEAMRTRAQAMQPSVVFAGRRPHAEIASYVAACDVAVMPATNDYGDPMKLYEYMAAARAIVAPDAPMVREILVDGKTALLAPPDPRAIAEALTRIAASPELRQRLGTAAAAAAARFSWTERARALLDQAGLSSVPARAYVEDVS